MRLPCLVCGMTGNTHIAHPQKPRKSQLLEAVAVQIAADVQVQLCQRAGRRRLGLMFFWNAEVVEIRLT